MAGFDEMQWSGELAPRDPNHWFRGTCNTLKAARWTVFLARWLGRRVEGEDMGCKCVGYEWRGKLYLTDFIRPQL